MILGYNTNGFAHHRLEDALDIIAATGYRAVAYTPDVHHPYRPGLFTARGLLPVIVETGARFLLDPLRKHHPTLLSGDRRSRRKRIEFLFECIDIAAAENAACVSLWSGVGDDWGLLVSGLEEVCARADAAGIDIGFEPEPGMMIDTMARFDELARTLPHPRLKLTLDVGHLQCQESGAPETWIERYADRIVNVHLDDHRRGVHDHLMFGDGEIDWPPVLAALKQLDVPATVELSRHSHDAVNVARGAYEYLVD